MEGAEYPACVRAPSRILYPILYVAVFDCSRPALFRNRGESLTHNLSQAADSGILHVVVVDSVEIVARLLVNYSFPAIS